MRVHCGIPFRDSFSTFLSITFLVLLSSGVSTHASASTEIFRACRPDSVPSRKVVTKSNLECPDSTISKPVNALLPAIQELTDQAHFTTLLRSKVREQLLKQKNYYSQLSQCGLAAQNASFCLRAVAKTQNQVRNDWPALRAAVAIANPPLMNRHWRYNPKPSHPYRGGAELKPLTADEIKKIEDSTIGKIFEGLPDEVRKRALTKGPHVQISRVDIRKKSHVDKNRKAMSREAKETYQKMIGQNPLLFYIDDVVVQDANSPSTEQLRKASDQMILAIESEIKNLNLASEKWSPNESKDRGLYAYESLIEDILQENPRFCGAATKAARNARNRNNADEIVQDVALVGASIVALGTCSTGIACGIGAVALAAVENGIARHKTNEAVRSGIAQAAASPSAKAMDQAQEATTNEAIVMGGTVLGGAVAGASSKPIKAVIKVREKKAMANWNPRNGKDIEHYFRTHVGEVMDTAYKFFDEYKQHFSHLKRADIQRLSDHDFEKFAQLSKLEAYGFKGVPVEIFDGMANGAELKKKFGVVDGKVQMAVKDFLGLMWGESKESLKVKIPLAKTEAEKKHLESMLELRNYMIESMERIESQGMKPLAQALGPQAELEFRFLEVFADKPVRAGNPITANEMGRPSYSTLTWLEKEGPDGLAKAISDLEGREAARKYIEKIGWDNVLKMAKRTDEIYQTRGVPTSIQNRIRNAAASRNQEAR